MAPPGSTTLQAFAAMAPQHIVSENAIVIGPPPIQDPAAASPDVDADAAATDSVDERRLRRRISNRESARRSRARKQLRLHELRDSAARLEVVRRELAASAQDARGRVAMVRLANAGLRAEAAVLTRRLAAATAAGGGACSVAPVDIEQTIASLIA